VQSVELWYDAQSLAGKKATVKLYGRNCGRAIAGF